MSKTVFVLGASGQVGKAVIPALLRDGWAVQAGARSEHDWPDSVEGVLVDRESDESFRAALGSGVDVLVDCVAYTPAHAHQITGAADKIGSAIILSSISVYADAQGRTLDKATGVDDFPRLPIPICESQARTKPGPDTYSTRKVAMEDVLLDETVRMPISVVRPGAIYGPGSVHPRELWFIKRALDKRPVQLLNWSGQSQFHRSNSLNIAELIRLAAGSPQRRALHAVDELALTTAEIGDVTNAYLDHHPRELMIPGASDLGDTPWSVPEPIIASMAEAEATLAYRPVATYADTLPIIVDQIMERLQHSDLATAFPAFVRANGLAAFDYEAEDSWVKSTRGG